MSGEKLLIEEENTAELSKKKYIYIAVLINILLQ